MAPARRPGDLGSDHGATLVEVLVALSILSIAGVAILAGIETTIRTSDMHREQSVGGANVRNYAEAVQDYVAAGNYDPCAGGVDYAPGTVGYDDDPGDPYVPGYDSVVPLAGDGTELGCDADDGVQRIRFTMETTDGRVSEELVVILRDPCASGGDPGC
jgi:prepilin-type N-terminal cleavage/methylation domain-containing protein